MQESTQTTYTADQFLEKLKSALSRDGDFPASAKIVNELKSLTSNPKTTANQITELILKEPSLGIRVLHLVNSTFYRRAKPIMTVSQAVVQIGMKPLADLCAGLVLLQKFVPAARSGGPFSNCLQKTLLSSLLSSSLTTEVNNASPSTAGKNQESGYLAGSFSEIGTLLLAYYFPQIYENALKRSEVKKQDLSRSIHEFVGLTPTELSKEVLKSLDLPEYYSDILTASDSFDKGVNMRALPAERQEILQLSRAVNAAKSISNVLVFSRNKNDLDKVLGNLTKNLDLDNKIIGKVLGELPKIFQEHCSEIELHLPPLPEFVSTYSEDPSKTAGAAQKEEEDDEFSSFVEEIRQAVKNGEPTASVITTVMETLAWGLKFDRVLLLLVGPGRKSLIGRMLLGNVANFDPTKFERSLGGDASPHAPDVKAFREGHPVFTGDPIFEDGWPIAATPIGFGQRAIGVIYAERVSSDSLELNAREQAAMGVLAELLDRSVSMSK